MSQETYLESIDPIREDTSGQCASRSGNAQDALFETIFAV
jgi:hypothetical protein